MKTIEKNLLLSVIVPVYNTEAYLAECVGSICRQTLKNIEIILVDDGSTDRSGAMCDTYANQDERIVVIHKENGGLASARKAGLRAAHGEYIGYVDSDDWVDPSMYADMLAACQREDADIVMCAWCLERGNGSYQDLLCIPENVYRKSDHSIDTVYRNVIYTEDYSQKGVSASFCNKLFRKELLHKYQFPVDDRIRYGEDEACVIPCFLHADKIVAINRGYYHYRMRAGSICHTTDEDFFEKITLYYRYLKKEISGHPYASLFLEKLNRYMLERVLWGINRAFGFGYGMLVPFYLPPYELIKEKGLKRIVLYGAGEVGQGYYRLLGMTQAVEVAAWVDRQWEIYRVSGLPVDPIERLHEVTYDGILIAVVLPSVADEIRTYLRASGVSDDKIFYDMPRNVLQSLPGRTEFQKGAS